MAVRKPLVMLDSGMKGELPAGDSLSNVRTGSAAFTNLAAGAAVDVTITWATTFGDTNYKTEVDVIQTGGVPVIATRKSKTATQVVYTLRNLSGILGLTGLLGTTVSGSIEVVAVHD